jgi:glucose/arabinose dehydrogenase
MRHAAAGLSALGLLGLAQPVLAQDVEAGRTLFRTQCLLCHTAEPGDGGGAQGPSLIGVAGRTAGTGAQWAYTAALKDSGLHWDAATLDRFLANPIEVVPGSAMVMAVPDAATRADMVAYLETLATAEAGTGSTTTAAASDWRSDAPGVRHRVDPNALPQPFATEPARNMPQLAAKPADAQLHVPEGFSVDVFTTDVRGPRRMVQAGNGDVFVAEPRAGDVKVLHLAEDGSVASTSVFASGLTAPYSVAFYPSPENPQWLYVGEGDKVTRFAYSLGDATASGPAEVVVPSLPAGGHPSRDIVFSQDGSTLFVAVGSASNYGDNIPVMTPEEAAAYDAEHGLGAAWGPEERRAAVLAFDPDGGNERLYATGLRNCVRVTIQPDNGQLWCTVNERDLLGDNLVPDYSTTVQEGGYYGWPWYYIGNNEEPRLAGQRPDLAGKALVPDVLYQAHSAALSLEFYAPHDGASAFPEEYVGDGFAVFHGSWNRSGRTGHKIVRVLMENGKPTGEYEDFLTGFIVDDGNAWARPAATLILNDGSMLLSDDGANTIYRISYQN